MIINGDCLKELKKISDKSIDLIYLDPPFFSQKMQKLTSRESAKDYSFNDVWENEQKYKKIYSGQIV